MPKENLKVLYSGNVAIYYGQFYVDLRDDDYDEDNFLDPINAFNNHQNGICGSAQTGKLFFVAGLQDGTISITVELHSSKPPIDDSYSEIVEVPFQKDNDPVSLWEWGQEGSYILDIPAGSYRVRYSIDGMDKKYEDDEDGDAPITGQRYLVQLWPSDHDNDKIIKCTSEIATYWHKEWGSLA